MIDDGAYSMLKLNLPSSAENNNDSSMINSPTLRDDVEDEDAGSKTARAIDRRRNQSSELALEF